MKTELASNTTPQQRHAVLSFAQQARAAMGRRIHKIILIGSVARGDFGPDSDIDIVVVADGVNVDFKCDVWDLGARVSLEHNVILNIHIYSSARWAGMQRERAAFWVHAERDGVDLTPEPVIA